MYRTDITRTQLAGSFEVLILITCRRRVCRDYAGTRAPTGRGLCAGQAIEAGRSARGPGQRRRGLRRRSVPVARRSVSRSRFRTGLPGLPERAGHAGLLDLRELAGPGVGFGPHSRRDHPPGRADGRVLRPRGRSVPDVPVEPFDPVVRCRIGAGCRAAPACREIGARSVSEHRAPEPDSAKPRKLALSRVCGHSGERNFRCERHRTRKSE